VSASIRLPEVAHPRVSIVTVTYGAYQLAREAVEALVEHTEPCYELIVVDNDSPDGTGERLARELEGARVILNGENLGFGRAANQGAEAARAQLVCHLNSDTLVRPGWLAPLLEVLAHDAGVGAVVPMLLNPDGTVQEAGSVVDSLGWALALGSGDDPELLEHRFRREIDFGSAACMLLRRRDFLRVGGFDSDYGTGYYEDVELCFRLAELGLRTVYEPRSQVVHVRFGSSSPELAGRMVHENRLTFFTRWHRRLEQRPAVGDLAASPRRRLVARDADALERLLVIDDRVPHTDRGSGDPRMAKLLLELADLWPRGRITLFAADDRNAERYAEPLLAGGVEVATATRHWWRWFETRPFHYSAIVLSRPHNFERFDSVLRRTQPQASLVFDVEALSSRRLTLAAGFAPDGPSGLVLHDEAAKMRRLEVEALQAADAAFCVSEEERSIVQEIAPGIQAFLVPTYVDPVAPVPTFEERRDLVFFGGFLGGAGSPNEDSLLHLVSDVVPLIRRELPDVRLRVVGADPTPAVLALAGDGIDVVGFAEDPTPFLAAARVHVNPLRYGAGIKLKLLDTMAAGLPFVTTGVGAEGLGLGSLARDLVAEEPEELAALAVRLYRHQAAWEAVQAGLLELALTRFGRIRFRTTLVEALTSMGFGLPSGRVIAGTQALAARV
jgi:GT2 family glycosyltransferase